MKPLEGLLVLELSQMVSGSFSALRLADLGARIIKIEQSDDLKRKEESTSISESDISTFFDCMNRNKESYVINIEDQQELKKVKKLLAKADVLIENLQTDTMKHLGLNYENVKKNNPKIVYGSITGYGAKGAWKDKTAHDLLVQALSGMTWLNGNQDQPPIPFGLPVVDLFASTHLVQGILAALIRKGKTNEGSHVEVSLIESAIDFQFEVLTTHLNDGGKQPKRSSINNAHTYLGAPYGIYKTKDGYMTLAMGSILELGNLLKCEGLHQYVNPKSWFDNRDEIKGILAKHLIKKTTKSWLDILEPADYWCADVFDMNRLIEHEGFTGLEMVQEIIQQNGEIFRTTRCPIRIDEQLLFSKKGVPRPGEDNKKIDREFQLRIDR